MIIQEGDERCFINLEDRRGFKSAIPQGGGLYMLGNTIFNPHTRETFFLVKIGMSSNLLSRMESYRLHNPLIFHIAYKPIENPIPRGTYHRDILYRRLMNSVEKEYHQAMEKLNFGHMAYSDEWFFVDENIYLEICEKGFEYFD